MHATLLLGAVEVGNYINGWKVLPVVIILAFWARLLTWIDKDADDAHLAQPARGEGVVKGGLGGAGDQEAGLEVLGRALHPAAKVDGVAERAVFELNFRADVADLGDAAVDADAEGERLLQGRLPLRVHSRQRLEHRKGGPASGSLFPASGFPGRASGFLGPGVSARSPPPPGAAIVIMT